MNITIPFVSKSKIFAGALALASLNAQAEPVDLTKINATLGKISKELVAGDDKIKDLQLTIDPKETDVTSKIKADFLASVYNTPWSPTTNQAARLSGQIKLKPTGEQENEYLGTGSFSGALVTDTAALAIFSAKKILANNSSVNGDAAALLETVSKATKFSEVAEAVEKFIGTLPVDEGDDVSATLARDAASGEVTALNLLIKEFSLLSDQITLQIEIIALPTDLQITVKLSSSQVIAGEEADAFKKFVSETLAAIQGEDPQTIEKIKEISRGYIESLKDLIWANEQ